MNDQNSVDALFASCDSDIFRGLLRVGRFFVNETITQPDRDAAASLLRAQEVEHGDDFVSTYAWECLASGDGDDDSAVQAFARYRQSLSTKTEELAACLEPFARGADNLDRCGSTKGDDEISHGMGIVTAGDLRRARAALASYRGEQS